MTRCPSWMQAALAGFMFTEKNSFQRFALLQLTWHEIEKDNELRLVFSIFIFYYLHLDAAKCR